MGWALAFRELAETPYLAGERRADVIAEGDDSACGVEDSSFRGDDSACPSGDSPCVANTTDATGNNHESATPPVPPPSTAPDIDAIEELGDEIATLAAHIHAATHRFLTLIAEFDRLRGWELAGYQTCAHWLAFRTGIDKGAAREKVRAARALTKLPLTGAAMARGELSFSQVRALSRVASSENEADLLDLARGATTDQLECMLRAWKKGSRRDDAEWEKEQHRSRRLSIFPGDDGMYVVKGRLMPEVGALLMRAIEAASDALYREHRGVAASLLSDEEREMDAAHRRADALGLLAERALAVGFCRSGARSTACTPEPARSVGDSPSDETAPRVSAETSEDGPMSVRKAGRSANDYPSDQTAPRVSAETSERAPTSMPKVGHPADDSHPDETTPRVSAETSEHPTSTDLVSPPISGTRAERYQVVLHVEPATLSAEGDPGRSHLEDGMRVSAETSRRLSCDASLIRVEHGADGSVLDVGRKTRTIPPAIRRALEARDRGCRFPGCGLRFTDAHHITHWADGGATSLDNCVLLCRHHHRLVHEGGWWIEWWGKGKPAFFSPRGEMRFDGGWEKPEVPDDPVRVLLDEHAREGIRPDGWTAGARWKREADIPDEVISRAWEAI